MTRKKQTEPVDDYPKLPAPRPVSNSDRRWFERRLGQMRFPGFADNFTPAPL